MKEFPDIFCIVDTETTGMRPSYSRIIDIGIIRVEYGKVVQRFETLLNPGTSIPPTITRITGLTTEDVVGAPSFDEVALQIQEILSDAVFVAHNASFDYQFLRSEFGRLEMEFSPQTLCSVQLSRKLFPKERSHSLDAIINRYGFSVDTRHRALPDAEMVLQFFTLISNTVHPERIREAIQYVGQGALERGTKKLGNEAFTDLPHSAGVYFFYGPEQELLYIGKSKHIRARARSHFHTSESRKEQQIQSQTATVKSITTSGELSALMLESALIKAETPLYNRALRRKKKLVIAKQTHTPEGYATVELEYIETLAPDPNVLGVFRSVSQAKTVLQTLSRKEKLCPKLLNIENGKGPCFSSQLGMCDGACTKAIPPEVHNTRLANAFETRRLQTWPFKGTVMIEEKETAESGTVFFVDNWILKGAFCYRDEDFSPLAEHMPVGFFDYDTYKILVRYMLDKKHRRSMRQLTKDEFSQLYAQCTGDMEV